MEILIIGEGLVVIGGMPLKGVMELCPFFLLVYCHQVNRFAMPCTPPMYAPHTPILKAISSTTSGKMYAKISLLFVTSGFCYSNRKLTNSSYFLKHNTPITGVVLALFSIRIMKMVYVHFLALYVHFPFSRTFLLFLPFCSRIHPGLS